MKAYHDYLELFEYFGRAGGTRLGREEFAELDAEFAELAGRVRDLTTAEKTRLGELKALLLRDKP